MNGGEEMGGKEGENLSEEGEGSERNPVSHQSESLNKEEGKVTSRRHSSVNLLQCVFSTSKNGKGREEKGKERKGKGREGKGEEREGNFNSIQ